MSNGGKEVDASVRQAKLREKYSHVWSAIGNLKKAKLDGVCPVVRFSPVREHRDHE